jgi:hypothetical protein
MPYNLATKDKEGAISVYSISDATPFGVVLKPLSTFTPAETVGKTAVSPDCAKVIYTSKDQLVCVDATGSPLWRFPILLQTGPMLIAISPDSTLAYIYGEDKTSAPPCSGCLCAIDANTGKEVAVGRVSECQDIAYQRILPHLSATDMVVFSCQRYSGAGGNYVYRVSVEGSRVHSTLLGKRGDCLLDVSRDTSACLFLGDDGVLRSVTEPEEEPSYSISTGELGVAACEILDARYLGPHTAILAIWKFPRNKESMPYILKVPLRSDGKPEVLWESTDIMESGIRCPGDESWVVRDKNFRVSRHSGKFALAD